MVSRTTPPVEMAEVLAALAEFPLPPLTAQRIAVLVWRARGTNTAALRGGHLKDQLQILVEQGYATAIAGDKLPRDIRTTAPRRTDVLFYSLTELGRAHASATTPG